MITIGILALQGDTRFHEKIMKDTLKELNIIGQVIRVKSK